MRPSGGWSVYDSAIGPDLRAESCFRLSSPSVVSFSLRFCMTDRHQPVVHAVVRSWNPPCPSPSRSPRRCSRRRPPPRSSTSSARPPTLCIKDVLFGYLRGKQANDYFDAEPDSRGRLWRRPASEGSSTSTSTRSTRASTRQGHPWAWATRSFRPSLTWATPPSRSCCRRPLKGSQLLRKMIQVRGALMAPSFCSRSPPSRPRLRLDRR